MRPLADASRSDLKDIRLVLTDMDDTLTFQGRLAAETYAALERLEAAGVRVIPVTAAPAGWCDQMVRMWPVTAVIGENGGFCFVREGSEIARHFWRDVDVREGHSLRLAHIAATVLKQHPSLAISEDQPFRLTSLAISRPSNHAVAQSIVRAFEEAGANATLNAIWAVAWLGGYDKIKAARKFVPISTGLDVDLDRDNIVFVGDSANDAPMFTHFPKAAGVSTITEHIADIPNLPTWVTRGPGGAGFVEVAEAILSARTSSPAHIAKAH